jgi:hypothetical protein
MPVTVPETPGRRESGRTSSAGLLFFKFHELPVQVGLPGPGVRVPHSHGHGPSDSESTVAGSQARLPGRVKLDRGREY